MSKPKAQRIPSDPRVVTVGGSNLFAAVQSRGGRNARRPGAGWRC